MNSRNLLDTIKGRLFAAEALLSSSTDAVSEKLIRKTLVSTTDALRVSLERLEVTLAERETIRASAIRIQDRYDLLLRGLPIAAIETSQLGEIIGVNPEGSELLNGTPRGLAGRSLLLFLEDRDSWIGTLRDLQKSGGSVRRSATLRPKERARKHVVTCIVSLGDDMLQWFLLPRAQAD